MKKKLIFSAVLVFSMMALWAQEKNMFTVPLIGEEAPSFTAQSTNGNISFPGDYAGKWKILFSHPQDFTPICSSEILELAQMQDDFKKLNVELVVVSVDPLDMHNSWKSALEAVTYKDRAPVAIKFPLVEDVDLSISRAYGMLHLTPGSIRDVRGVFVIDPDNKIRATFFYPLEIGRNLDELERTVTALQTHDSQNVLTPANWKPGEDVFIPYQQDLTRVDPGVYSIAWFMLAKKTN
ncbi:MAG: peroxiredoxin [Bacteroidales bacterium]|nr:peroxiredoxin [Bacteroidales bacterium]